MLSVKDLANKILEIDKLGGSSKDLNLFVEYVEKRGASSLLPHVVHYFERLRDRESKSNSLVIRSSHALSPKTLDAIRRHVKVSNDVSLEASVDTELIGGFVAEHDYTRHDTTLRTMVQKLRASLI